MTKFFGSVRISVGATSSTPESAAILSPKDSCMTALEKAKKMEEFGGCTRRSAPTPSTRFPHSETTPEVRPTINRTKMTWMAMAMTLRELRSGRATILPHNIWKSEKVSSKVSFIKKSDEQLYHSCLARSKFEKKRKARIVPNSTKYISARLSFQHKC